FLQARMLQHPLENQLAPVALGLLPLQRTGQIGRLVTQTLVELLQPLELLGQREPLARLVLVAVLDALLERLDALLQRIEQLSQALVTGIGKALLALIENLPSQLGELCTQLVTRALQILQALLMGVLLLTQLSGEAGMGSA